MKRILFALTLCLAAHAAVPAPEQYFGFRIGSDKKLVRWDKIVSYFELIAVAERPRQVPQPRARPRTAIRSSCWKSARAENLRNLDQLKNART